MNYANKPCNRQKAIAACKAYLWQVENKKVKHDEYTIRASQHALTVLDMLEHGQWALVRFPKCGTHVKVEPSNGYKTYIIPVINCWPEGQPIMENLTEEN